MVEIEKPRITCLDTPEEPSYGKYVVEPLERGYGMTLGNSLRRILLSSLPGYAATSVKIAGVQHEFSTVPGVSEDVTEIVLNVKQLILKLYSQGTKTVYIDAVGPCEVTAADIKADGEVMLGYWWSQNDSINLKNVTVKYSSASAPSVQANADADTDADGRVINEYIYWSFSITSIETGDMIYFEYEHIDDKRFDYYEQAVLAGIEYVLDNLI